jgi:hypothetical protein
VIAMFPTSEREYFTKVVDARWVFSLGDKGVDLTATLYQNNREQIVKRLDDAEGQRELKWSIGAEKRFEEQTAAPGSETALRHLIAGLSNGAPNYDEMVPAYAEINRRQLPMLQASLERLGAVQSVIFKSVGQAGEDIYDVQFERARLVSFRFSSSQMAVSMQRIFLLENTFP